MQTLNRTALILAVILFTPFLIAQTAAIAAPGTQTAVSGGDTITVTGSGWTASTAINSGFSSTYENFDDGSGQIGQVAIATGGLSIDGSGNLSGTFTLSDPPVNATRVRIQVKANGGTETAISGFINIAVKPKLIGANVAGGILRLEFDQLMTNPSGTASASTFTEAQATGSTAPDLTGVNVGDVTLDGGDSHFLLVAMSGAATALVQNNTIKVAAELLSAAGAASDLTIPAVACTETPSLVSAAYDATTNQLTLTFSLVVDRATVAANLTDLGITDGSSPFNLGSATLDTSGDSNVMQITLNNGNDKTLINFSPKSATVVSGNIQDTLGNNVGASTGVTISFTADASAPTVTDIRQQAALDTVLITFSDMIDAATVAGAAFPISGRTIDSQTLQSDGKSILVDYDASITTATDFVDISLIDNNTGLTMIALTSQTIDPLYDADGTITSGPTTTPTSLDSVTAAASYVDVFDFRINDGGSTDGQPLLITDLTIDLTGTTASNTEQTWRLNGPDVSNIAPTTVNATTLTFTGLTISVADSSTEIYTLSVKLHATPSSTDDNTNDDWAFDIDRADFTVNPAGSQMTTGGGTAVTDATLYEVTATQLTVDTPPSSPTNVGAQISATIHFTDAAGNIDTDNTGTITCAWSEAGTVTNPTEAAVSGIALFDGTSATDFAGPGIVAGTITWSSGGVTSALTTPFHLQSADDADSTIAEGTASPATLSSVAGSTTIFNVDVTDLGTSDTLGTIIDEVTFTVTVGGGNDATDFAWALTDGISTLSSPTVGASSIAFTGGTGIFTVANGTSKTLQLKATPNTTPQSQTDFDEATITLSVADTAFTIDGAGSTLATGTASNTTDTAVAVVATTHNVFNTDPTGTIAMGAIPTFDVEYVDANGNRDLGVDSDTLTITRSPAAAGTPTGDTAAISNGLGTFGAYTPGMPGSLTLVMTFTDDGAGDVDISGSPLVHGGFHLQAADDADTTVAEVSTGPATLSSVAGATQIFEIIITDLGTSDGKDTVLDAIKFNVTVSGSHDATDYTWTLHQGAGAIGTPVTNPTDVTISGVDFITISNNSNDSLQLKATLNATNSTAIDGSTIDITIAAVDFTEDGTSSTIVSSASVDNSVDTVLDVVATAMGFVATDTAATTGQTINITVEYKDANGNRDLGAGGSEQVTVTWSASATVNNGVLSPTSGLADFNANALNMTGTGALGGTLTFTDNTGGVNLSGSPITQAGFNLVSTDDADSTHALSGVLTEPTTISSLAAETSVLDFTVTDSGLSDGLDTNLTQVVVNVSGTGDAVDGQWELDNGGDVISVVGVVAGTIGSQTITFTVTSAVSDGSSETYIVSFDPTASPTNTIDNQTFILSVDESDITLAAGTTIAAGAAVTNGAGFAYDVVATAIAFVSNDTAGVPNVTILAVVEYVDAGGNRDLDVTDTVTVTWSGGGSVNNAALAATAGLADFDGTQDMNIDPPGVTSGTVTFTDDVAGINLSASPITIGTFNLVAIDDADVTIAEVATGPAFLASIAGATAIETVRFTDAGTSDGKTAILDSITFTVALNNNTANDCTDFDWFLNDGTSDLAADTVTATTVTFTKAGAGDIITIANGGTDDVILKANLKSSLSDADVDGAQFDITVANGGITMDPGGTGLQSSQSVDNAVDTQLQVTATVIAVVGTAPTSAAQDTAIALQVEFTDANGNRDRDAGGSDQLTATSGDFGAASNNAVSPTNGLVNFQGAGFQFTSPGTTGGTITITDNAGGVNLSASPITVTPFHLIADDDADSTISENASATALSSIAPLTSVFEFDVTDSGTSDTLPTIVNAITFDVTVSGADDATGFIWQLTDGITPIAPSNTTATTVVFTSLSYSTADGGSTSFVLKAATTGSSTTIDNATIAIALNKAKITVAGGATSTSFSAGTLSSINDAAVGVVATELNIFNTLSASYNAGNNITVDVEYVDTNGNRDEDVAGGDLLTATRDDAGTVDSGATGNPTAGALSMSINLGWPAATTISLIITDDGAGLSVGNVTSATFDLTADSDTTVTENASQASMTSLASLQAVMSVDINDQGTVDVLQTRVDIIVWDVAFTTAIDANDFTWELFNGTSTFSPSAVTASTVTFDNSGSGGLVDAADGATATLTLRAQVLVTDSAILDGTDIQASVDPANVTVNAGGSDVTGAAVPSTTDTTVGVTATKIQVSGTAPTTANTGAAIALQVEFTDAGGNRDLAVTDDADLTWSGTGSVTNGTVTAVAGLLNYQTEPTSIGTPGALGGAITITDQAAGTFDFSGSAITVTSFNLVAPDDADGTIVESGSAPATLSSIGGYTTIWSMQVTDLGTSDGIDTTITGLVVNLTFSGSDDSSSFDWQLTDGTTVEALDSSTATTLTFSGMSYVASDGANKVIQLQAKVKTATSSATIDNDTIAISVADSDVTTTGSSLAGAQTAVNATDTAVDVDATNFNILTQPPASIAGGSGFDVSVEYVDANGNRDIDVTTPETATLTRTDAGTVTAGTSAVAAAGISNFTTGNQVVLGGPTGSATTLLIDSATLTIAQATTTGITVNPIAEVTVATAGGTMATTVSSIGSVVDVVDFKLTDAGVDDADASITQVVVQLGGTADATDGAWTLDGPDHGTPLVGVVAGTVGTQTVTFTTAITIADGTNEDYVVHFLPTATTLSSADGQTFTATVAFGAVTAAASGSGMTSGTTSNTALAINVIATEMQFASTPPSTAGTGATISTIVNYTDVNGNIDTAHAGTITATWSGSATVTNGAVVAVSGVSDFGTATLSIGTPGALAGTITFGDSGAFADITINPFNLVSPDDADGTVTAGALSEPSGIASIASATNVFDFVVTDSGTSDGKTTDITQIVVNVSGTADANDATWTIAGTGITGTPTATVAGSVGSQTLTWSGLTINIADNSAETYVVACTPAASPSATTDNQNWILSIDDTDITVAGSGSSLTTSTAVTNGAGLAYQVTATALAVTTQPPASVVGGAGFDVVVKYVDANGNVDTDVTDTITGLTRSDAGTVSGPSLPLAVTSGVASFTGGSQVVIGLPAATAITLTFTDDATGTLTSSTVATTSFNVTDTTAPTVSSVALDVSTDTTGRTIKVTFSEPVDQTTAETAANYTLQTGAVTPTSATRHATNLNEVTLVFADYAVGGTDTLDVSTVQDVNTNVMAASTGTAITSSDSTAPTLIAISFNDVDASSTVTAGDEYIFTFSEAMNDRPFAAGNTADSLLSPNSSSYGTPNSMVMGEDVGFGTDSRVVVVTIVAGFTANGTETIILGALTDVSGNTVTATSMTLSLTDTVGPRLNTVALDDHDNSGNVTAGDTLILTFSEQIDPASVPASNGPLDAMFLSSGTFGTGATAVFQSGDLILEIEIGTGVTGVAGATIDPSSALTDKSSNADITAAPVTIGDGTTDTWGPTTAITYSANPAAVGNMTITVNFSDSQTVTPTIAINQPGTNDTATTAMSMGASTRIWTYTYNVIPSDGVINADGTNTVTIVGLAADAQSNAAQAATGTTFVTDTGGPIFASAGVSDTDNFYMSGETIGLICNLGETGLTVTADLSTVDSALSATTALTDNANNTYSITSAALSSGTLIEGSNLSIMLTATDSASNTTTFPVLVTIDNTAPTANLLYNQPSTAVGQGNLVITLQLNEPAGQVPQIAISGITGTPDVTATAMTGSVGDTAFTYTLAVIAGSTGTATVTCTLVNDIAGNTQATIGNNTFVVNAAGSPALTANAGTDVSIAQPQIVTLDASASTGTSLTYAWVQETGPAVTITNGTTSMPTFVCQTPANYTFRVTVTSGASSGSDTVSVTLTNCVPEVSAGQRVTLDENEVSGGQTTIGLQGDTVDCNAETLYFVWSLSSGPVGGNLLIDSPTTEASTLSLSTGTSIVPGVYLFQLDVYDPAALISGSPVSDTMAFVVTGTGVNPPASHAGIEQTTEVGTTVTLSSNEASDSDGTLAVFQWSIDSAPTGSTATLSSTTATSPTFTPDVAGIYEIGLRVTDNAGMTSDTVTVTLIAHASAGANQLPRAVITADHTDTNTDTLINTGESLDLDGSSSVDANGDTLTYQWKQISGPVLIIPDPDAATFTLTPSTSGQYGLELCVNDGTSDGICATYWFQVVAGSTATVSSGSLTTADDPNSDGRVLYIPGVGVDNASGNPSIELDGTASSGTGITHQWRQVQGPTVGLTNAATATASFTPVLSRVYVFELTVTDSSGTVDVSWLTVIVDTYDASANPGGNAVPESQPVAPASVTPGAVVTLTGAGTDANTPQTSWTWHWVQTDGPPVVLDLTDPQNPTFIPPVAGTYKFLLFIDDGADISTGSSVSIAVAASGGGGGGGDSGGCAASGQGSLPLWILLMTVIPAMYIRRRRQA